MLTKKHTGETPWVDLDDAPPLTSEFFCTAEQCDGEVLVQRGRPRLASPEKLVSVRLDVDVLAHLRARAPR